MQDRGSGGCVPGGQSSTYSEIWSCTEWGKNYCLATLISLINVIASSNYIAIIMCTIWMIKHIIVSLTLIQEQYRFIFELVLLFLDSFSIYSNFK